MIRLLIAVYAIFLVMACESPTESSGEPTVTGEQYGDTLYITTTYPVRMRLNKGGDSVGGQMFTIQQKNLDTTNGVGLFKMTERTYGEGFSVDAYPIDILGAHGNLEVLTAPSNLAYYFDLEDSSWITVPLQDVLDSMVTKGVWE